MSLSVNVGMLAYLLENDAEGAQWLREGLERLNEVQVRGEGGRAGSVNGQEHHQ